MGICCSVDNSKQPPTNLMKPLPVVKPRHNTFVELLIINRILFKHESQQTMKINDITKDISNNNDKKSCRQVLSLISKHGIKEYLSQYHISSFCNTIDIIFTNIILENYSQEYHNILTSTSINVNTQLQDEKSNVSSLSNEFRYLLFNQTDLMSQIFQYLELTELNNCSIVNFIWLVHAFNINSIYDVYIHQLPNAIPKYLPNELDDEIKISELESNQVPFRVWQRFINVRSLHCGDSAESFSWEETRYGHGIYNYDFIRNFSLLKNIVKLDIDYCDWPQHLQILKILSKNSDISNYKIEQFSIDKRNTHPQFHDDKILPCDAYPIFRLPNAKIVEIGVSLPVLLSSNCHELCLSGVLITPWMYLSMVVGNDCDLTGVETLILNDIDLENNVQFKQVCNAITNTEKNNNANDNLEIDQKLELAKMSVKSDTNGDDSISSSDTDDLESKQDIYILTQNEKQVLWDLLVQKFSIRQLKMIEIRNPNQDILTFCRLLNQRIESSDHDMHVGINATDYMVGIRVSCTPIDKWFCEDDELNQYKQMIEFINNASGKNDCTYLKPQEIEIDVGPESPFYGNDLVQMTLESHNICQYVEKMCLVQTKCRDISQFLCFITNMIFDNVNHPRRMRNKFSKLQCVVCNFTFDQARLKPIRQTTDWDLLYKHLTSESDMNGNYNRNIIDKQDNITDNSGGMNIFWKINVNVEIEFDRAESVLNGIFINVTRIWQILNELYIKRGKEIDFSLYFETYTDMNDNSNTDGGLNCQEKLSKICDKFVQDGFIKQFGDLAVVKDSSMSDNHCASLYQSDHEIWCTYHPEDSYMEFVVRNVTQQNILN